MQLPRLRRDQWEIAKHPARIKVLPMGRRWGKTIFGGVVCASILAQHGLVAWVTPTYRNSRPLWRWLRTTMADEVRQRLVTVNNTDRIMETRGGGMLALFSGDNIDAIRGWAFHAVVLDEAARLPETAWVDAIMPTLSDYDGDAILISTPKGKNWFYDEYMKALGGARGMACWTAPSNANPLPQIRRAYDLARERVPERTFVQEWEAQFIEGGVVFRRLAEACVLVAESEPQAGHQYIFGVDWGKAVDWTVISVVDATTKRQVYLDRFNQIDFTVQRARLTALFEKWRPLQIIAEQNSFGIPVIEELQRAGLPVRPFVTSNASKTAAIEALALALEKEELELLNDGIQRAELQAFEMSRLPSGLVRYEAPAGMHDDCVMALALAWDGARQASSVRVVRRSL